MEYDYIFCGFGLSAVVVLDELIDAGLTDEKKILIIEREFSSRDTKTWCFWEQVESKWNSKVAKSWNNALFKNATQSKNCLNEGMAYKMLDSQKFFDDIELKIANRSNIDVSYEKVISVVQLDGSAKVFTDHHEYKGKYVFNSIYDEADVKKSHHPLLLQHFLGWYIKAKKSSFDPDTALLMDFSIPQKKSTRFMYVLPLSDTELLVEFTLFSPNLLSENEYKQELEAYLKKNGVEDYKVIKKETGIIPMTAFPFWKRNTVNILHIGTAGGWTKSSTGYTFNNARVKAGALIKFLDGKNIDFREFHTTNRFYWYDRLFVAVLFWENEMGYRLFSGLFLKSNPAVILRFLDERSSLFDELQIILACPKKPFLKALSKIIFRNWLERDNPRQ